MEGYTLALFATEAVCIYCGDRIVPLVFLPVRHALRKVARKVAASGWRLRAPIYRAPAAHRPHRRHVPGAGIMGLGDGEA